MRSQKMRILAVTVISLIMALLRLVIITFELEKNAVDTDTYYLPNTLEVKAFTAVTILFVLVFIYSAFTLGKKKTISFCRSYGAVPAGSLILGFALIGAGVIYVMSLLEREYIFPTVIGGCVLVFTFLSAFKFLYSGLFYHKECKRQELHALAALLPILFSTFRLLGDFIRSSAAPLASSGAYHIVGLVAVLLYFLCEGKSYVSETSASSCTAFGYVAIYFLFVYSLPNLVLHCFGTFVFNYYTAYSIVDLALAVYIAVKLSSAKLCEKEESTAEAE